MVKKYDKSYGSRAKVGLIVPASNTVCEPEIGKMVPTDVNVYAARILFRPTIEGLRAMRKRVRKAAEELSSEGLADLIAFCCTVGSLIEGTEGERGIISAIEQEAHVMAITTATAVKSAFRTLGVRKVAVATPYTRETNVYEKRALEEAGYEITSIIGYHDDMPPQDFENNMIGKLGASAALELALKVDGPQNEAIFISCTNFRCGEVLQELESLTGKPVVSSNQATTWLALRKLGLKDKIRGYGRLMEIGDYSSDWS